MSWHSSITCYFCCIHCYFLSICRGLSHYCDTFIAFLIGFTNICGKYPLRKYIFVPSSGRYVFNTLPFLVFISAFWDYSPSRELTAMVYPAFEYTLIIHLVLDFFAMWISYKRGYISWGFWTLVRLCFPIEIVLCAWFRKCIHIKVVVMPLSCCTAGHTQIEI